MKSTDIRKNFEEIRTKRKKRHQIDLRMIAAVQLIIIACIGLSYLFDFCVKILFPGVEIPTVIELLVVSLVVGFCATTVVSKIFYRPVKKLRERRSMAEKMVFFRSNTILAAMREVT